MISSHLTMGWFFVWKCSQVVHLRPKQYDDISISVISLSIFICLMKCMPQHLALLWISVFISKSVLLLRIDFVCHVRTLKHIICHPIFWEPWISPIFLQTFWKSWYVPLVFWRRLVLAFLAPCAFIVFAIAFYCIRGWLSQGLCRLISLVEWYYYSYN